MSDIPDAHVVVDGTTTDMVPAGAANLFSAGSSVEVVEKAAEIATALKDVVRQQGLIQRIKGREHPKVEAWQTLGAMLGISAVVEWTRQVDGGWEARVLAQRVTDGHVVGAGEAQCTHKETMWKDRDDYALRSMAQTRATSKALKGPLGFVMSLAGYETTPAEEMPTPAPQPAPDAKPRRENRTVVPGQSDVTPDDAHVQVLVEHIRTAKAAGVKLGALRLAFENVDAPLTEAPSQAEILGVLRRLDRDAASKLADLITGIETDAKVPF